MSSIADSIRERQAVIDNKRNEESKKKQEQEAESNRVIELQRRQAEEDLRNFNFQQAQIQKQIDDAKAQEQKTITNRKNINEAFDTRINKAISDKQKAISAVYKDPRNRAQTKINQRKVEKDYNGRINKIVEEKRKAVSYFEFRVSNPGKTIPRSVRKTFESDPRSSLSALVQRRDDSKKRQTERNRRSSITTAQSNAVKAQTKLNYIIRDFEKKKQNKIKQEAGKNLKVNAQNNFIQATKRKTGIKDSSFFRQNESSVIPRSIIGTTTQKSAQAVATFKETQRQQRNLFFTQRKAQNAQEAQKIRSRFRESNPLTGTANVYLNKGQVGETFGVLIQKKLSAKFETTSIKSGQANPKLTAYGATSNPQNENTLIEKMGLVKTKSKIPEYIFLDESGNTKKITQGELYRYASSLLEKSPSLPSKQDQILNNYISKNIEAIQKTNQDTPSAYVITRDFPFEKTFLNQGTEARASVQNLFRPEDQQEQYVPTLEARAFDDLLSFGESKILGTPSPKNSKAYDYFKENIKTPEGQAKIAGSVVGSLAMGSVFVLFPPLIGAKYGKYVTTPKTKRIAEGIAQKLRETPESIAVKKSLSKFPDMPEGMKREIVKKSGKEKIVGVEMLDSRTALIKRGTEFSEETSPFIVVKNTGKNPRSTIYETYTKDKPGTYKQILISGKQNKELTGGIKQTKDIVSYPGTPENLLKASQTNKLAKVGSSQTVQGLEQNPKYVIEAIEKQKVKTGSILLETERLNKIKGFNRDVNNIGKPNNVKIPKGKKQLEESIKLPGSKPTSTRNMMPKPKGSVSNQTINPLTQRKNTLEKMIKQTIKSESKQNSKNNIQSLGTSSLINLSTKQLRSDSKQGIKQSQTQINKSGQKIITDIQPRQSVKSDTTLNLKQKLSQLQKQKPILDPKFSLLVGSGQRQGSKLQTGFKIITKQDTKTTQIISTKLIPDNPITRTAKTTPSRPGIIIPEMETIRRQTGRTPRLKKGFWRTNVNTDSVGAYLPTRDLSTGRTRKVITRIDALERRINNPTKKQTRRTQRKEANYFQTGMKKKKGNLFPKSNIYGISKSKPKNKTDKKRLKRFSFDFGF